MNLEALLIEKKTVVTKRWFDLVVKTYPSDTRQFLKSQKDPFANPVGQTTFGGLQALYDQILKGGVDREAVTPLLDPIIRIRAVQDFSPSMAVAFILDLKKIVRDMVGADLITEHTIEDWLVFTRNVDALTLIGFDIYMSCREKIFALKADNERTRVHNTFARAGLLTVDE